MRGQLLRRLAAAGCLLTAAWITIQAGLPDRAHSFALYPVGPGQLPVAAEEGALAPPIEAVDLASRPFSLAAQRGKPVIVNFWATYCGPCLVETPLLETAFTAYRNQGLQIVGIDAGETSDDVLAWKTRFAVTYPLLIDGGNLSALYRAPGLPATYFIARDGTIRHIIFGPLTESSLQSTLATLVQ